MLETDYLISQAMSQTLSFEQAVQMISLLDLTNLDDDVTEIDIAQLANQAITEYEQVAGVCVLPRFLSLLRLALPETGVRVITVLNFPEGNQPFSEIEREFHHSNEIGIDEIDIVFPYQQYLAGQQQASLQFITDVRQLTGSMPLKVIVETGAFTDRTQLLELCQQLIALNVNFLKTSTGRYRKGASFEAVAVMLQALQTCQASHPDVGLKVSGGISELDEAAVYLEMIRLVKGNDWIKPNHVRIGSSRLLAKILSFLASSAKVR